MHKAKPQASRGFTLLELIIVIAILAILSVAVVLVINPAETLARARDSQRLSDLSAIKSAIGLYMAEVTPVVLDANGGTCALNGWHTTTTNVDDAQGMCGKLDAFLNQSDGGTVDGLGWLPVDLLDITAGAPLSNFPIDPTNTIPDGLNVTMTTSATATDAFIYMYMCNTANLTFELTTNMESARYERLGGSDKEATDGGNTDDLYELGTSLLDCPAGGWGA